MTSLRIGKNVRRVVCSRSKRVAAELPIVRPLGLCSCCDPPGSPLLFEYEPAATRFAEILGGQSRSELGIWRYEAWLPVVGVPASYAADVGRTPVILHDHISKALDVEAHLKLEGGNPSGSFKDRGLAVALALGCALGASRACLPTQGNAGVAASIFCARLTIPCVVFMPARHEGSKYHRAADHFGASVRFFGANIAEAGAEMRRLHGGEIARGEMLDVSTFFEPGRLEGKKTMGLEIAEHFGPASIPDWILYPTGGGTGLVGIWKALRELGVERLPRMVAVQSTKCPPVVEAFERGLDDVKPVTSLGTIADGLDVPGAIMGHGILDVVRASGGTAIAVDDESIAADFHVLGRIGVSASYEAAATLAALRALLAQGTIKRGSRVLLLVTAGHGVALPAAR